jgi:hypothetical protein
MCLRSSLHGVALLSFTSVVARRRMPRSAGDFLLRCSAFGTYRRPPLPLISMYQRDNSRVAYRILANRAVEMLIEERDAVDDVDRVPLVNLSRLLEHYRYDDFSDGDPSGILDAVASRRRRGAPVETVPGQKPRFEDLRVSLDRARRHIFGEQPKENVVEALQGVLSLVADGDPKQQLHLEDLERARHFFRSLAKELGAESEDE